MLATFGLLGLAICSVWLPHFRVGNHFSFPPWWIFLTLALSVGLAQHYLSPVAIVEIVLFTIVAFLFTQSQRQQRCIFGIILVIGSLLLAMHRLPGFQNPVVLSSVQVSHAAVPFTQYMNFDKAVVGLILLAFVAKRTNSLTKLRDAFTSAWIPAFVTITGVLVLANVWHFVRPDIKLPDYTLSFLAINLLFTCVAEEVFFRSLIQDQLASALSRFSAGTVIAIFVSGLLFGLVHLSAGMTYAALAVLVGIGYATVYARAKTIEPAILTHFAFNALHFIFFTYPY